MTPEITPIRLDTTKDTQVSEGPHCSICGASYKETDHKCNRCGFPVNGTEEERSNFDLQYQVQRAEYEGSLREARKGTNALYWLAGLAFLGNIIVFAVSDPRQISYLIAAVGVAVLFVILAQWSKKKPYEALLSALIIYIVLILGDGIADPKTLAQGFIVKIIIIVILGRSIKAANEARNKWSALALRHWDQPITQ